MPELSQQNARSSSETENLFRTPETTQQFFSIKNQMIESTQLKDLFVLFKEKNIKETQLKQLNKMEEMNVASKNNNLNVLDIPLVRLRLRTALGNNEQQIAEQVKTILANNQYKPELRRLVSRNRQLLDAQKQLAEAFSEEIINEQEVQRYKDLINKEFDVLCSGPFRELYKHDLQAMKIGSESDLSYLEDLTQLDEEISPIVKKKLDDYEHEKAKNLIELAEQRIAKQAQASSKKIDNFTSIAEDQFVGQNECDEDKPLPVLYKTDSADAVYELLLNGADPIMESKDLELTPLTRLFASRYILEQELNRVVHISIPNIQAQLDPKLGKQVLVQQFSEKQEELKTTLSDQIETLQAQAECQPELKMDLEDHIQALSNEAKQLKFKLKNDLENQTKALKKKTKPLTPELKREGRNQLKRLEAEAGGLELELKNNAALIDAHIKAIVLRDVDVQLSDYPDVVVKKRFLQTWNNCKQEVKALQQTQLTENCTAYNFLTQDLAKLSTIKTKTMKGAMAQFPEYKPLLQMQRDLLDNYQLVQGTLPLPPTTELKRVIDTSNHSVKILGISEIITNQKSEMPSNEKKSTENNLLIQRDHGTRLNNSGFFNANVQLKSRSVPEKTSEGPAVDRSKKPRNVDTIRKSEDELVKKRQHMHDKKNRVQFTGSTIERDDLKEQQNKQAAESKQNLETANPSFKSRLDEFLKIYQETDQPEANNLAPEVNRQLKPRLAAQPNFFSTASSSDQDDQRKEIDKKRFAYRQKK